MPADLLAKFGKPRDARLPRFGQAGLWLAHRRDVHTNATHAQCIKISQFLVVGLGFVEINNATAYRRVELAHGIEHAVIVEAVGARLYEHVARETEPARQFQISFERFVRRLVADVGAVRVFAGRAEHMEMRVARVRWRRECRCESCIGIIGAVAHYISLTWKGGSAQCNWQALYLGGVAASPDSRLDDSIANHSRAATLRMALLIKIDLDQLTSREYGCANPG